MGMIDRSRDWKIASLNWSSGSSEKPDFFYQDSRSGLRFYHQIKILPVCVFHRGSADTSYFIEDA